MALFQVIYMSSLAGADAGLLPSILEAAVRNNKRRSLTGMMLYSDGNILQVLEGEDDLVHQTFHSILADARHHGVFVLKDSEIAARHFTAWSMGFKQLTSVDLEAVPAAASVFRARGDEIALRVRQSDALDILKLFAEG